VRESSVESDRERLEYAHLLATGRVPTAAEIEILSSLLEQQRGRLRLGAFDAATMLGVSSGRLKQLTGETAQDFAPWLVVCRALLNLDETITKQ
jgi:hypothetical protein